MRIATGKAKKTTARKRQSPRRRPRRAAPQPRIRHAGTGKFTKYFLPAVVSLAIIGLLATLATLGYRTVTASDFFNVRSIDVSGVSRSSAEDVRRIVVAQTEKTGVWNADLPEVRQKLEKLPFVRWAAVSRVLPGGIRVVIEERIPIAIVRLAGGEFLIDAEGEMLSPPKAEDRSLKTILGWDEAKTERAAKENQTRVKMFQRMLSDWREFGLAGRVRMVDLADVHTPRAAIEDSGAHIPVALSKENYAKSLKSALEAVAGKGEKVRSVDSSGVYPVVDYAGS